MMRFRRRLLQRSHVQFNTSVCPQGTGSDSVGSGGIRAVGFTGG